MIITMDAFKFGEITLDNATVPISNVARGNLCYKISPLCIIKLYTEHKIPYTIMCVWSTHV